MPKPPESLELRTEAVVKILKEKGSGDPEAESALLSLIAEAERTADANSGAYGRIGLDRFRANVYLRAGNKDEAVESLKGALMQASGEGDLEVWDEIMAQLKNIGATF